MLSNSISTSKHLIKAAIVAVVGGTFTGCVAYQRSPLDPAAELDALRSRTVGNFVVERAKAGETNSSTELKFDPSDGLSEAEVVAVALTLNPALRAKRLEIGEAQALLISAGLWPNPEIGIGWRPGISGASGTSIDADLLFELLRPGERSARKAAANARIEQAKAEVVADELATVVEVRTQRMEALAAEQTVDLLQQEVALRDRAMEMARQRRRLGEATELDVSVAELEAAEVRRDLRKAQTELETQRQELNRLMGLPPAYALRLEESGKSLTFVVYDDITDEELDRRILAGRPELRAKQAEYQRSEEELRLAVAGQYPRLRIGPSFQRELEGDKSLGVGVSAELPVFNRNQGEIAEKQAARERTGAEYTATLHRVRAEGYAARTNLRRARLEVETQEREVLPLIQRNQDLFEGAFRARELSVLDWVTAQQRALRARREYLEALVRYRVSMGRLEAAMGTPLPRSPAEPATKPTTESQGSTDRTNQ